MGQGREGGEVLDVVVEEELAEDVEFLGQELVGEVHGGVEDTQAVLSEGS
jgi:hypothetical protein